MNTPFDPLSLWTTSFVKEAILNFVADVTNEQHADFVPVADRIAVFDNDGTLWVEKPLLAELTFIKEQLQFKRGKTDGERLSFFEKLKDVCEDAAQTLLSEAKDLAEDLLDGVTIHEYEQAVKEWISQALHPRFKQPYTSLTYSPMQQVLRLFQQHQFQCFIVSGGSTDFIRPWSGPIYQIDKPNVIGSSLRTKLVEKNKRLHLEYLPIPFYFDNGAAKVRSIARLIGKQPIAAFGNSSGDIEMLRYTRQAPRSLACLIHHTDDEREYAYSPDSSLHFGKDTLEYAKEGDWEVVNMKLHWLEVFGQPQRG